jgi:peptidoglycan/LPS O-acetylase OafA/YrhL
VRAERGTIDSNSDSAEAQRDRITAIQLLRALAALAVAAGHIAFAFADHLGPGLGLTWRGDVSGQLAVMLFFIVSGYVMVVAAERQFGRPGARSQFWRRRIIRIMPPYWIASLMLAAIFLTLFPTPIDPAKLAKSLALIPYWPDNEFLRPLPFLWVGWTLFYEMMFYLWFGLFIGLPRARAILAVAAVLAVLVIAGHWVPPVNPALFAATRPISVMFVAGMVLALWRARGGGLGAAWRWLALLSGGVLLWAVPVPDVPSALGWDYLLWCGAPALLIALAALAGPLPLPAAGLVNRAGDISYALYLLHVPVAWFWLWFWPRVPFFDPGPWDYLVSAVIAAVGISWVFYTHVERPMTLALNRRLAAPHSGEDTSRKTP